MAGSPVGFIISQKRDAFTQDSEGWPPWLSICGPRLLRQRGNHREVQIRHQKGWVLCVTVGHIAFFPPKILWRFDNFADVFIAVKVQ